MQSFQEYVHNEFKINFEDFQEILKKYKILLSGSTALYFYMIQEGMKPSFIPNDLDLYYNYIDEIELNNLLINLTNMGFNSISNENEKSH
jgi:hypothetical protein